MRRAARSRRVHAAVSPATGRLEAWIEPRPGALHLLNVAGVWKRVGASPLPSVAERAPATLQRLARAFRPNTTSFLWRLVPPGYWMTWKSGRMESPGAGTIV
jgi:hypothetical protein